MNFSGYICAPHNKNNESIVETWKKSDNVGSMYFVTATFPSDSLPYFPNHANHYVLAKVYAGIAFIVRQFKLSPG